MDLDKELREARDEQMHKMKTLAKALLFGDKENVQELRDLLLNSDRKPVITPQCETAVDWGNKTIFARIKIKEHTKE
jgi:hypothetical protein